MVIMHIDCVVEFPCQLAEKFYQVEWECDGFVTTVEDNHFQCTDKSETIACNKSYQ